MTRTSSPAARTRNARRRAGAIAADAGTVPGPASWATAPPSPSRYTLARRLEHAATRGDTEQVRALIKVSDPTSHRSRALRLAAAAGHLECVRVLIPVSDARYRGGAAMRAAATNGHADCVDELVAFVRPSAVPPALSTAAAAGHLDCVRILVRFADRATREAALLQAVLQDKAEVVQAFIAAGADVTQALAVCDANARLALPFSGSWIAAGALLRAVGLRESLRQPAVCGPHRKRASGM